MTTISPRQALVLAGVGLGTAGSVFALDAVTKQATRDSLPVDATRSLAPGIGYGHIENPASAYGLPTVGPLLAVGIAAGAVGAGIWAASRGQRPMIAMLGAGLVAAGAAGNIVDRAQDGSVTDMLHVTKLFNYFNVADLAITGGLGLTALAMVSKAR